MTSRKAAPVVPLLLIVLAGFAAPRPAMAADAQTDAVSRAIEGEFALQQGDVNAAGRDFLVAALASTDPALAEHATRIAMAADDLPMAAAALARWRQLAPDLAAQTGVAIHIALRQGKPSSALAEARSRLTRPDGWKDIVPPLAEAQTDRGVGARTLIRDLLEHGDLPQQVDAWLSFAGLARRLSDEALAHDIEKGLIAQFPADPRAQLVGAAQLREGGDVAGARAVLDRVLHEAASNTEVRNAIAEELAAMGDPKAAAQALAQGAQDDQSYALRAGWLSSVDDQAGMAALYAEIKASPVSQTRMMLLGELAETLSRWPEAERWYRAVTAAPLRDRAQLRLPSVLEKQGHLDAAMALLRHLQDDAGADGQDRRDAYLQEADLWAQHKDDKRAMATYSRGLATFDDDAILLYGRGLYQQGQGRIDAALADLKEIIDRDGSNAEALNAYGYTLAESRHNYSEALPYIEKSNQLKPNSAATLDSLGWVELKLGDRDKALPLLRQAWGLQKDAEIAAHLGEALWLTGDQSGARQIWKAGLALDAENQPLQAVVRKYSL